MGIQRTFGKLGNRSINRLQAGLEASLVTPDRTVWGKIENVSRLGCRLQITEPPRVGATTLVRFAEIEVLGTVSWVRGTRCGVKFPQALTLEQVERIRWIADHKREHESETLTGTPAVWR